MRNHVRRIIVLVGVIVALLLLSGLLIWRSSRHAEIRPFDQIKDSDVAKLSLSRGGDEIVLAREGAGWQVTTPKPPDRADKDAVEGLLLALRGLAIESEVSSHPESLELYGLNAASATRVALHDAKGKSLFDGEFGKEAIGYQSAYFRWPEKPSVYLATGVSPYQVERSSESFRDHALLPQAGISWSEIRLKSGARSYILTRSSAAWTAKPSLPARSADSVVATLFNMRLAQFLPEPEARRYGKFSQAVLMIEAEGAGKAFADWTIGAEKPYQGGSPYYRYAVSASRHAGGLVSVYDVESLLRIVNPKLLAAQNAAKVKAKAKSKAAAKKSKTAAIKKKRLPRGP